MKARIYKPEDYDTVKPWWVGHGVPDVSKAVLPPLGVIVEDDEGPVAVCWLYLALGVGVSWLAWLTTKPGLTPFVAAHAVKYLVQSSEAALPPEYGLMAAMPQQESYKRLLESEGYIAAHACTEMFKPILR